MIDQFKNVGTLQIQNSRCAYKTASRFSFVGLRCIGWLANNSQRNPVGSIILQATDSSPAIPSSLLWVGGWKSKAQGTYRQCGSLTVIFGRFSQQGLCSRGERGYINFRSDSSFALPPFTIFLFGHSRSSGIFGSDNGLFISL